MLKAFAYVAAALLIYAAIRPDTFRVQRSTGIKAPPEKIFALINDLCGWSVKDEAEADKKFAALGKGGQATMPLAKTFFSPKFGMVQDKFGVSWMVMVDA